MSFEVTDRDGLARTGVWSLSKSVKTPNILFINTERVKAFSDAEILLVDKAIDDDRPKILNSGSPFLKREILGEFDVFFPPFLLYPHSCKELHKFAQNYNREITKNVVLVQGDYKGFGSIVKDSELYILGNAYSLFLNPREFVNTVIALRKNVGQGLIYAPALGMPNNIAILVYLGIDLFDSLPLIINARLGNFLSIDGKWSVKEMSEIPCSCSVCSELDSASEFNFENLLMHNYIVTFNELRNIRNAIKDERLREIVESRIRSEPLLVSMLRILDFEHYKFQEMFAPIVKRRLKVVSKESLYRVDIIRFQRRLKERYKKPASVRLLLLLPCSAKKPYSFSRSHALFRRALMDCENHGVVHEVIVTSPLGIVPRELELFYPAQQYDIAVTGVWDSEEIKMIQDLLSWLLKHSRYEFVISHLSAENDFLSELIAGCVGEEHFYVTCTDRPTSGTSLKQLAERLSEITQCYDKVSGSERLREDMESLALFQFGNPGKRLIEGSEIKGRYPNLRIFRDERQLGMLTKERGMLSLTLEGGKVIGKDCYWVEIDDFKLRGSVFAVGVKDAYSEIRAGDEVIIWQGNEVRGVGVAMMSAKEMVECRRGEAVKVRHRSE